MVADALAGKIDLIITKSVSRFARNTVDSLTTIRELKEHGIEVYFEKENIWTSDGKGELLLTIMSSLAQEESRSISENCTWGQRKRFADGKVTVPFQCFLGYDRRPDGNLVVNPKQALIVQRIYGLFLQGVTYHGIAKQFTADGIPTPGGKVKWSISTIKSILSNERYKGDAFLQKSFTVDFLTKKPKANKGEIPQYYVEDNHEAIIAPDTPSRWYSGKWQSVVAARNTVAEYTFSPPEYGAVNVAVGMPPRSGIPTANRRTIWQCNHKFDGDCRCSTPHLSDDDIKRLFLSAANRLFSCKEIVVSDIVQQCIFQNAYIALDQAEYHKRYDGLTARFEQAKARLETVMAEIRSRQSQRADINAFIKVFESLPQELTEFTIDNWLGLVDYATIYSRDDIRFTFKNGQEMQA